MLPIYLQGLTMGLAYVAPIGAQNLFVINAAVSRRRPQALLTALIVVFFDVSLALACFFGAGAVMERFPPVQKLILLVGSLIVMWIGFSLLRAKEGAALRYDDTRRSWGKVILNACVVTWFNPQAILDGTVMLGAFRATLAPGQSLWFMLGSASASCLWFFGITLLLSFIGKKITPRVLLWINRVCGGVMLFYGLKLLYRFFTTL